MLNRNLIKAQYVFPRRSCFFTVTTVEAWPPRGRLCFCGAPPPGLLGGLWRLARLGKAAGWEGVLTCAARLPQTGTPPAGVRLQRTKSEGAVGGRGGGDLRAQEAPPEPCGAPRPGWRSRDRTARRHVAGETRCLKPLPPAAVNAEAAANGHPGLATLFPKIPGTQRLRTIGRVFPVGARIPVRGDSQGLGPLGTPAPALEPTGMGEGSGSRSR